MGVICLDNDDMHLIASLLLLSAAVVTAAESSTPASNSSEVGPWSFTLATATNGSLPLASLRGKVILLVNTASRCGFTKQYAGLQKLYAEFHPRGLEVVGVPSNDFGAQEPGTDAEIQQFCTTRFQVSFPVVAKVAVKGPEAHPLYRWLTEQSPFPGPIAWNFTKFLVGRDGRVLARWPSRVAPDDEQLRKVVSEALDAPAP